MKFKSAFPALTVGACLIAGLLWAQQPRGERAQPEVHNELPAELDVVYPEQPKEITGVVTEPVRARDVHRNELEERRLILKARLSAMEQEAATLRKRGQINRTQELMREMAALIQELRALERHQEHAIEVEHAHDHGEIDPEGHHHPEEHGEFAEMRHRIEHLHQAAEHLQEAGQHDVAQRVRQEAEELEEHLHRELERRETRHHHHEHGPVAEQLAEMTEIMQHLRMEVRALRQEVRVLRHALLEDEEDDKGEEAEKHEGEEADEAAESFDGESEAESEAGEESSETLEESIFPR